mmetsp:Transcript_6809/g.26585  ORF Transcript_6809/g.26585 Transcript_6809/m.26585 type:complete len:91 (-) Transcript_6809:1391-1663(-)
MDVAPIYLQVIRNVIEGVRADFSTEQFEEASLTKLAKLWEQKVLESGSLRSFDSEINTESRKRAVFEKYSHVATSSVEDAPKTVEGTKGM